MRGSPVSRAPPTISRSSRPTWPCRSLPTKWSAALPPARLRCSPTLVWRWSATATKPVSPAYPTRTSKIADEAMTQLNSLSGPDFDRAYGTYQLRLLTAVVAQYGAYSQDTNNSAPLRRYAQTEFPNMKDALENVTRLTAGK